MVAAGLLLQRTLLTGAILAGMTAGVGVVAPHAGPSVMTMDTMADLLGVERYQDTGTCNFWVTNMSNPVDRIERAFPCSFHWDWSVYDQGDALVHEALVDLEQDQVFQVPNMERGNMEEWYHVDGHMLTPGALAFTLDGDEDAGVLMPPPHARDQVTMGWVSSGGQRGAAETLLVARDLQEQGTVTKQGVDTVHWASAFQRERVTWHGYDVYLSEEVEMWSDPRTAWVLEMHRHVVVEMTPGQMVAAFGQPVPLDGGDPQPVMELVYETNAEAVGAHADQARLFQRLMIPIDHGQALARWGAALAILSLAGALATRTIRGLGTPEPGEERAGPAQP